MTLSTRHRTNSPDASSLGSAIPRAADALTRPPNPPPVMVNNGSAFQPSAAERRTQQIIDSISSHTGLAPDVLARQLLLPTHYRVDNEAHAVLLTIAIQLWLEGATAEAAFSQDEEQRVIERAVSVYRWADPVFVTAPRLSTKPPSGSSRAISPRRVQQPSHEASRSAAASTPRQAPVDGSGLSSKQTSRARRWQRLAAEMQSAELPEALIRALDPLQPLSRHELRFLFLSGKLRRFQLNPEQTTLLRDWLLPSTPHEPGTAETPPTRSRAPRSAGSHEVREFQQAAQAWSSVLPGEPAP